MAPYHPYKEVTATSTPLCFFFACPALFLSTESLLILQALPHLASLNATSSQKLFFGPTPTPTPTPPPTLPFRSKIFARRQAIVITFAVAMILKS